MCGVRTPSFLKKDDSSSGENIPNSSCSGRGSMRKCSATSDCK